jgi:hypothetical protein
VCWNVGAGAKRSKVITFMEESLGAGATRAKVVISYEVSAGEGATRAQVVISYAESVGAGAASAKVVISNEESAGAGATCVPSSLFLLKCLLVRVLHSTVCAGVVILFENMCVQVIYSMCWRGYSV